MPVRETVFGWQNLVGVGQTQSDKKALLNVLTAAAGPSVYDDAKVGLFVNDFNPSSNTILADLTQPIWAGYALGTLTWDTAARDRGATGAENVANMARFTVGAGGDSIVYGAFLVNNAGTVLIQAVRFTANVPVNVDDQVDVIASLVVT